MWQQRRFRKLLNIIERLPRHSHYIEAIADDEEVARQVALAGSDDEKPVRRMREWSVEVEILVAIAERLGVNITAVQASAGIKQPLKLPTLPRPRTAIDRWRELSRREQHSSIVARLLPDNPGHP